MKKIRLLNFLSNYKTGLTQAMTEQTEELVKENKIDLYNVSSQDEQEEGLFARLEECNAKIDIIPNLDEHRNFKYLAHKVAHLINKYDITHVNAHTNWQFALLAFLKAFRKTNHPFKIIYTIHGYRHNSYFKSVLAISIIGLALKLFADRVISMSSYVSRKFWFLSNKTDIVYYMMKGPQYDNVSPSNFGKPLKMVFPAQFRNGKNQDILIKAVSDYIKITNDRTIKLFLPGDGNLKEYCQNLSKDLGIQQNVIFPGKLKLIEVARLYKECNIALCASNVETYGRCIAEPFMLGRCILTRKTGVAPDIISHGENGLFFINQKDLVKLLIDLHHNPDKITQLASSAFENRKIFARDKVMKTYINAISKA